MKIKTVFTLPCFDNFAGLEKLMRSKLFIRTAVVILAAFATVAGVRLLSHRKSNAESVLITQPLDTHASQSDRQIQIAEGRIKQLPGAADGYNLLAAAYMQKARETGDFGFNARAESALNQSLELAPDDREARTMHASLMLTYHRFGEALEEARRIQSTGPESAQLYGVMTDALVELGDYPDAVKVAQQMINLRPDAAAYSRVSYLRALHGDLDGAIEAMRIAVKAASATNPENAGWYRVHLGVELMNAGKRDEAEREFDIALNIFPGYHLALAAKGRARTEAGDFGHAVDFYRQAQERVPLPEYAIALGDIYTKLGRTGEARQQYDLVEFIERTMPGSATLYSRQLALFWADHDMKLDDALEIVQRERQTREDVYTYDALAWCLYKKGRFGEARAAIDQARRLGTRDARIFYHSGMIYDALGDRPQASKYLKLAIKTDSAFDVLQAEIARQKLGELGKQEQS